MLSRFLILKVNGRELGFAGTYDEVRKTICELPEDDVDTMTITRLYSMTSFTPPSDVTKEFAMDWAKRLTDADPVPAFLRHHVRELRAEVAA